MVVAEEDVLYPQPGKGDGLFEDRLFAVSIKSLPRGIDGKDRLLQGFARHQDLGNRFVFVAKGRKEVHV